MDLAVGREVCILSITLWNKFKLFSQLNIMKQQASFKYRKILSILFSLENTTPQLEAQPFLRQPRSSITNNPN